MPSFDIVSRTELAEVDNAIQGAMREIGTRFDFKGSHCTLERAGETITIHADDDMKLRQIQELLRNRRMNRGPKHADRRQVVCRIALCRVPGGSSAFTATRFHGPSTSKWRAATGARKAR